MSKKTTSASQKAQYGAYKLKGTWLKNRIARLTRHIKKLGNDKVASKALDLALSGKMKYRRN